MTLVLHLRSTQEVAVFLVRQREVSEERIQATGYKAVPQCWY
jgi:hypothetical protein